MAHHSLGELGKPREPVDMDFLWFGETIRVAPTAGDRELLDFLERAAQIDASDEVSSMVIVKQFLLSQVHGEDWARFMQVSKENNQQFVDFLQLAKDIVTAVSKFPTGRPSDSVDGPPTTNGKSPDAYSSAVRAAAAQLKGRPDLKMTLWLAEQARREPEQQEAA